MARLTDRDIGRTWSDAGEIRDVLARCGVSYHRFERVSLRPKAEPAETLAAHAKVIEEFGTGRYAAADVIDVDPSTPGLDEMLQRFATEHTHLADEVRVIVGGRGLFHIHPQNGRVFGIEVAAGDAINLPAGLPHWFHLCDDRTIRAIRLFEDPSGWVPAFTGSGLDARYAPLCFGAAANR